MSLDAKERATVIIKLVFSHPERVKINGAKKSSCCLESKKWRALKIIINFKIISQSCIMFCTDFFFAEKGFKFIFFLQTASFS